MKKNSYVFPAKDLCGFLAALTLFSQFSFADTASSVPSNNETSLLNENYTDEKWYEKSFQDILNSKIVTATRNESSVNDAPSVVSVYSRQDIQRMGLRSVKELLERTTGFFISRQLKGAAVGSRGFLADMDQILLLIDGHNMNSIIDRGMGYTFLAANLEHVERVEIIRGPGSTLWGSDAALGIIHIITRNGGSIDGLKLTTNISNEDKARHVNLQAGEEITEDIDVMASLTFMESDGFELIDWNGNRYEGLGDEIRDSYELYAKAKIRNFTVKARAFQFNINRPYNIFQSPDEPAYSRRSHYYVDITHQKDLTPNFNLETRVFTDILENTQTLVTPLYAPNAVIGREEHSGKENSLGLEMLGRWQVLPNHQLLLGFRKVRTRLSPVTGSVTYPIEPSSTSVESNINHVVIPDDFDVNTAIFIEDAWAILPNKLNVIAGIRIDDNNLREDNSIVLPRLAVNWKINESLQAKYLYNTGYIRPSAGIGFLGQELYVEDSNGPAQRVGIKKSQEIASHDLQFIYTRENLRGNINFYHTNIDNPFLFVHEEGVINGVRNVAFYINGNTITKTGTEMELAYQFDPRFDMYASIAYVFDTEISNLKGHSSGLTYDLGNTISKFGEATFVSDGTMSGYPHLIAQLGVNWNFSNRILGNIHLRYWDKMNIRDPKDLQRDIELGSEHYVDFNIRFPELLGSDLDAALFVKNLLNNDDSQNYLILFNNTWEEQGRRVGVSLSYTF